MNPFSPANDLGAFAPDQATECSLAIDYAISVLIVPPIINRRATWDSSLFGGLFDDIFDILWCQCIVI